MIVTIKALFTGRVSVNSLSGPVGIYSIVGESSKAGIANILYLVAFLSINVGFINLLPFPAFDGGHILFIIIEKLRGKPVSPELENKIHTIGMIIIHKFFARNLLAFYKIFTVTIIVIIRACLLDSIYFLDAE